ncbi:MAG: hypothetical protein JW819_02615 [Candidatus Krumholzibacteriota bacterium]|nr:hypothetical protein [Candidatus Krumholzibacteriota bacterium]
MSGAVTFYENAGSLRWLLPEIAWAALILGLWALAAMGRRADRAAPYLAAAGLAAVLAVCLAVRRPERVLLAEGLLALDGARLVFRLVLIGMGGALLLASAGGARPVAAAFARPGAAACARLAAALLALDLLAGTTDLVLAAVLLAAWLLLDPVGGAAPARAAARPSAPASTPAGRRPLPGGALLLAVFLHGAVWLWAAAGRTGPGAGAAAPGGAVLAAAALAATGGFGLLGRPLGAVLSRPRGGTGTWRPLVLGLAGLAAGGFCLFRLLDVLGN